MEKWSDWKHILSFKAAGPLSMSVSALSLSWQTDTPLTPTPSHTCLIVKYFRHEYSLILFFVLQFLVSLLCISFEPLHVATFAMFFIFFLCRVMSPFWKDRGWREAENLKSWCCAHFGSALFLLLLALTCFICAALTQLNPCGTGPWTRSGANELQQQYQQQ